VKVGRENIRSLRSESRHILCIIYLPFRTYENISNSASFSRYSTPRGLEDVSKYPNLFTKLLEDAHWSADDLKKLAGLNFLRVLRQVEQVRGRNRKTFLSYSVPVSSQPHTMHDTLKDVHFSSTNQPGNVHPHTCQLSSRFRKDSLDQIDKPILQSNITILFTTSFQNEETVVIWNLWQEMSYLSNVDPEQI
jgi:hypothetical protein